MTGARVPVIPLRTANSLLTDTQYAPCGLKTSLKQPQFLSAKALHEI